MNVSAQTIGNQIRDKIRQLFMSRDTFISEESEEFTALLDELDKLGKVDGIRRSIELVRLYTLAGNREKSDYYLRNSRSLHANPVSIALAELMMLINLGYYTESLPVLRSLAGPTSGVLSQLIAFTPANGAFHVLSEILERAKKMNLSNIDPSAEDFTVTARIMDQWGDTDEDYSRVLEIAGAIMRERKLFHRHHMNAVPVENPADGGLGYVKLSFNVGVDIDTAIDMTSEYSDRLASARIKIPPSMVFEFEGVE